MFVPSKQLYAKLLVHGNCLRLECFSPANVFRLECFSLASICRIMRLFMAAVLG